MGVLIPGSDSGGFSLSRFLPPGQRSATRQSGSISPGGRRAIGFFEILHFLPKMESLENSKESYNAVDFRGWADGWFSAADLGRVIGLFAILRVLSKMESLRKI